MATLSHARGPSRATKRAGGHRAAGALRDAREVGDWGEGFQTPLDFLNPYVLTVKGYIANSNGTPAWTLEAPAGTLTGTTPPTLTPTHVAPATAGSGELKLVANAAGVAQATTKRTVKIYEDHLARDMDNFWDNGGNHYCGCTPGQPENWQFSKYGTTVTVQVPFWCGQAAVHARLGYDQPGGTPLQLFPSPEWDKIKLEEKNPNEVAAFTFRRNDVVAFQIVDDWVEPTSFAHWAVCTGEAPGQTFGGNSKPFTDSGEVGLPNLNPGYFDVTTVLAYAEGLKLKINLATHPNKRVIVRVFRKT